MKYLFCLLVLGLFVVGCEEQQLLFLKDRCSEPGVYCEDVYKTLNDTVSQDLNSSVTLGYGSNDTFVENYSG